MSPLIYDARFCFMACPLRMFSTSAVNLLTACARIEALVCQWAVAQRRLRGAQTTSMRLQPHRTK